MSQYDITQVCLNGHIRNDTIGLRPERNEKFCAKCGEKTITQCPECSVPIRGAELIRDDWDGGLRRWTSLTNPPAHCTACGKPFPWTIKALNATKELAEELELSNDEAAKLEQDATDIISENPRTQVATLRIKKVMQKIGEEGANILRGILVNLACEAAKKQLGW
jgi:hypothetical protein